MIACVFIFSLLTGVSPSSVAGAGNVNEVRLAVDHAEYRIGETVRVTIKILDALDVNGVEFTLRYPTDKLRLLNGGMTLHSPYVSVGGDRADTDNGTLSYAVLPEDPVNAAESAVGEAVFTVVSEGTAALMLDGITAVDSNFKEIVTNTQDQIMVTVASQETSPPSSSEPTVQSTPSGGAAKPAEVDREAPIDGTIGKPRQGTRTFQDILTHWAKDDIEKLAARHVVEGVDDLHFAPEASITRAQFTAMAARVLGLEKTAYRNRFQDIRAGEWYAEIVQAAADSGLIEGDGDVFRPDDTMTREEMAAILVRAYDKRNGTSSKQGTLERFEDRAEIAAWAVDAVKTAVGLGIVQGMSDTQFMPRAAATRAQAAVMIGRLNTLLATGN